MCEYYSTNLKTRLSHSSIFFESNQMQLISSVITQNVILDISKMFPSDFPFASPPDLLSTFTSISFSQPQPLQIVQSSKNSYPSKFLLHFETKTFTAVRAYGPGYIIQQERVTYKKKKTQINNSNYIPTYYYAIYFRNSYVSCNIYYFPSLIPPKIALDQIVKENCAKSFPGDLNNKPENFPSQIAQEGPFSSSNSSASFILQNFLYAD